MPNAEVVPFPARKNQPPRRRPNLELRSREYLTPLEVDVLIKGAKSAGRHKHRDATLILIAYRHGLRVSELVSLRWDQVDLIQGKLHVNRLKNGSPSIHPLRGPEIRAFRRLQRDYQPSPYIFSTEREGPLTTSTFRKLLSRAGKNAELPFPVHPHMLRHACGFKLANDGQDTRAKKWTRLFGHQNALL